MSMQESTNKSLPNSFERVIKPILKNTGFIGSIICSISYFVLIFIMIFGFDKTYQLQEIGLISAISAIMGLIINHLLKTQGVIFAKDLPTNKAILEEYNSLKRTKKESKKRHINYFFTKTTIKDIIIKGIGFSIMIGGVFYLLVEGSGDISLLLTGLSSFLTFVATGLMNMSKAYDFYNEEHINYMKEKIKENKKCQNLQSMELPLEVPIVKSNIMPNE